jgi:GNAT superfamily N-acetyltransferase
MERAWRGREIFADMWARYYTDFEPGSCFVADDGNGAVGYITGCIDTAVFKRTMREQIMPALMRRLFTRGFVFHPRNIRRLYGLWRCTRRGETAEPDLSEYRSHLHINLRDGYRGSGAGAQLISQVVELCRQHGSKGIQLGSISRRAIPFFSRNGFVELSRRRFTLYDDILEPPTYLVFMGMKL